MIRNTNKSLEVIQMATSVVQIRMDPELRDSASETFEALGLDLPSAICIFLKKAVAVHGFPFDVRTEIPNDQTLRAMENVEKGVNLSSGFSSVAELMEDLNADD